MHEVNKDTKWLKHLAPLRAYLRAYCRRRWVSDDDTEDFVQEGTLRVLLDCSPDDDWRLIECVGFRGMFNAIQKKNRHSEALKDEIDAEDGSSMHAIQKVLALDEIEGMSVHEREVLYLTELCGMTQAQAAAELGISQQAVSKRLEKMKMRL